MKQNQVIRVTREVWSHTWYGLRERGLGVKESACIWAGRRVGTEGIVDAVYFLDDFDGVLGHERFHHTPRRATTELFSTLRQNGQLIIADIHTHPGQFVGLSDLDEAHPIEFRPGLLAIVIPNFAEGVPNLKTVGLHVYLGDGMWDTIPKTQFHKIIKVTI